MKILFTSCLLLALAANSCGSVQPVKVEGIAMEPTLKGGDRIIIDKNVENLVRGDIIVFYFPLDPTKSYIKRVVGLPGEIVEVRNGRVLMNRTDLDEPYVVPQNNLSLAGRKEMKIPADSYYVLGDNRDNSSDSRIWGTVQRRLIYGKFLRKYYSAS